ncbi:MAG: hypothetical protein GY754_33385 [bacterium]|nr:hypothetical protein [bacterium]
MAINSDMYLLDEYKSEYCTGIFSDELDKLGYKNQVSINWKLNKPGLNLFGFIRTLTIETIETKDERIDKGLNFLGSLNGNEIFLVKGSSDFAYFGELMSRLSREIGLSGVIIDGLTRDTFYTHTIDLPIFARGYSPVDIKGRGRVAEVDVEVEVNNIKVKSGDLVFADNDGVVFIPKEIIQELIPKINEAAKEEFEIKKMISDGKSIAEILNVVDGF